MADRIFALESGRGISLSSSGDSLSRRMVFLFLPTGAAGSFDPDPIVTDSWGVRLMVIDRPGYASSAPLPDGETPGVEGPADDVAEYVRRSEASAEKVSKADFGSVGVVGWGTGAPFALAFAARHPDLVDLVAIAGAPAPRRSKLRTRGDGEVDTIELGRRATVQSAAEALEGRPWNRVDALGIADDDSALSSIQGLTLRLDRTVQEASTQGSVGVATDLIALADDSWAAELSKVTEQTLIVRGELDPVTDADDAKWFARRLAGSEVVTVPDAGHLVIASAWERILAHVAPKHGLIPEEMRR